LEREGLYPSTLRRSLIRLKEKDLVFVKKQYFKYGNTLSHRNCYLINTPPVSEKDPDIPLKEILSLKIHPEEKAVLSLLFHLANPEGDTFSPINEILSYFTPKPHRALKSLMNKGFCKKTPYGVQIITEKVMGKLQTRDT
ncbi:MAG: hypothetical protein Q9N26_07990, partial [Aquificota bacterium]|nr:hypothetical protein [Aquificota bacterium]